jgi:ABC-type antimicrobial peptide transport system permease subunit
MPLFSRTTIDFSPPSRPDARQPVEVYTASPEFFGTLGIPLVKGREFKLRESSAVIVSEALARAFWPRQNAIGKTLTLEDVSVTVVGVVKNVDPLRFGGSDNPAMYRPWRLSEVRNVLSVRFDRGEASGAAAVRTAVHALYPDVIVLPRLVQTWIDQVTEDLWNIVALIVLLGMVATVLAASGIYGAVSFAVNQRTRELGIRVALGAQRLDIYREVFLSGGRPVAKGLAAGLWLALAMVAGLGQSLKGSPIRLDSANPLLYAGVVLVLGLAAVLAMAVPARRGSRADPLESLRCD